jgi:dCTP deaminase
MTILSGQTIRRLAIVEPMRERYLDENGNSAGLSAAGYDITVDAQIDLAPGQFVLACTCERFVMPRNVVGVVHDKSSLARKGLAVQNTILEPGWRGYLTLELSNHSAYRIRLPAASAIAQVVFHFLDEPAEKPYGSPGSGSKYQDQERMPIEARKEIYETKAED